MNTNGSECVKSVDLLFDLRLTIPQMIRPAVTASCVSSKRQACLGG